MITYEKAGSERIGDAVKIRVEMLSLMHSKPEADFGGEFTRLSEEFFGSGDQTTILAYDGEKAVGCATLCYINVMPTFDHPTGNRAHLMNVYTNADYRRQGIARQMVTILLDEAKEKGVTYISLDTTKSGAPLYKALGFDFSEETMGLNLNKN